jgi:DedD protein
MGLLSFLKGQGQTGAERADASSADTVQAARARARRRLIGAAVLLGIGVLGFPLLFETQPRPIAVDIPIEIPRKEAAPSLPLPPPRVASAAAATARISSGVITQRAAEVRRDAAPAAAASRPEAAPRPDGASPAASAAAPKAAAAPVRADDGGRARALLEGKPSESAPKAAKSADAKAPETKSANATVALAKPAAPAVAADGKPDAAAGRFVVQVGAFSEAASATNMRQRVEQLGFKCYTQVVEVDGVKRIRVRVGPFAARDEAERAAGSLKAAGLSPAVLTL